MTSLLESWMYIHLLIRMGLEAQYRDVPVFDIDMNTLFPGSMDEPWMLCCLYQLNGLTTVGQGGCRSGRWPAGSRRHRSRWGRRSEWDCGRCDSSRTLCTGPFTTVRTAGHATGLEAVDGGLPSTPIYFCKAHQLVPAQAQRGHPRPGQGRKPWRPGASR